MNSENIVIFKGTKDGISIYLDENAEYEDIKVQMEKKIEDAAKFFDGVRTNLIIKGKALSDDQETELLEILTSKTNMSIAFLQRENEKDISVIISEQIKQYNITKYYRGAVRSGQSIDFAGSVVVLGDVNPGGVVRAEGNIIILGTLKGMAHAGYKGMTDAFVIALAMRPVQLRIADVITRFPDYDDRVIHRPEYAYIEDGQIYAVPLV